MYAYSQAWNIKHFDDGYYKLFIYNDENKTLCYENGDIANGANVFLDEDNNQDNCKWTIKKICQKENLQD